MGSRESDTGANGRQAKPAQDAMQGRNGREAEQQERSQEHSREQFQERRKLRRLQAMMELVVASIAQDPSMTVDEAAQLAAHAKRAALRMFPDKEGAFDLLCRPRIQRVMRERFRIQ